MALFVINDISASKFSINGREMFKTFTPVYLNESTISVSNIYDSTQFLFRNINVSDVEVDSVVYANATDLVTALVPVIFVPQGEGSFSQAQIDQNTADILALQTNKADINHNHNTLYYLKTEIDSIIAGLPTGESIASGQVVFSDLIFYNDTNVELFRVDCTRFLEQGTTLTFSNGLLSLKNDYNVELSNVNLNIQTLAYDDFIYAENIALDYSNLLYTNDFILVKNISNETLFLSKINLSDSRLIFDFASFVTDLTSPVDTYLDWFVYEIDLSSLSFIFIESVLYRFDFRSISANIIDDDSIENYKTWSANKLFDEFALKESLANKGVANGYAPLNASVKIDSTYLPSYVDDTVEGYFNGTNFYEEQSFTTLITPETDKIYINLSNTNPSVQYHSYRWSGTVYFDLTSATIPNLQEVTDVGATTTNQVNIDTTVSFPNDYALLVKSQNQYAIGGQSVSNTGVAGGSSSGVGVFGGSFSGVGGSFDSSSANIIELKQNGVLKGYVNGDGDIKIRGILDNTDSIGASGQILSSTGTGVDWIDSSGILGTTNLSYTASPTNGIVVSDTGTDATIPLANGTNAGLLSPANFTTLNNGVWSLLGNAGTNPATNFIGTTDNVDLLFRTNNTNKATITSLGQLIVGDNLTPSANTNRKLVVDGASGMILRNLNAGNPLAFSVIRNSGASFEISNEVGDFILGNFSATNGMLFRVGGIERARFLATGNLGIGLTTPESIFQITSPSGGVTIAETPTSQGIHFGMQTGANHTIKLVANTTSNSTILDFTVNGTPFLGRISYSNDVDPLNGSMRFATNAIERFRIQGNGNIGLGTTTPTSILGINGNSTQTIKLERHTTSNTAGNSLTILGGGATSGATDKNGGNLILQGGIGTGTGSSDILFQTSTAGATGTTDNTQTTKMIIKGSGGVGIGTTSPQAGFLLDVNGAVIIRASSFITNSFIESSGEYRFSTGGTNSWVCATTGSFGVRTISPTKTLDINGELRIRTLPTGLSTENILVVNGSGDVRSRALFTTVPATATSTGSAGQMAYDSSFFYICTATDTWRRVAIATW